MFSQSNLAFTPIHGEDEDDFEDDNDFENDEEINTDDKIDDKELLDGFEEADETTPARMKETMR